MADKSFDNTIVILLVGEASGVFAGFCPSWFTVSSPFFHEQDAKDGNVKRIRWGEAAATVIVLGTGWAISRQESDYRYLTVAAAIAGVFVAGYEYMIANPSSKDGDGNTDTETHDAKVVSLESALSYNAAR